MKKIPSLYKRDWEGDRLAYDEVTPGCEWVLSGEGAATIKMDGTCCMVRGGRLFKRFTVRKGKRDPVGFELCREDANTGKRFGWVEVVCSDPAAQWHWEAWAAADYSLPDGTYELCGPKVQGNPHKLDAHEFFLHGAAGLGNLVVRTFEGIRGALTMIDSEGIVWHHPDGRMAKIKRRDFGLPWPLEG